ncbi:MAG: HD domain-containing protein [Proteobacteria bacterium]|nr:HD domain-containing protein [Pseudomonadota bacterium]MCP4921643.1 HD domain-containing protein [Pseudomonadota bacterium]
MEVRDPIHGAVALSPAEQSVVAHPFFQRLRNIKQVGFTELAFPGAVHSRYLHSLGVMHLAGRAFDRALASVELTSPARREAFRQCVRLAGLLHDVGHAPFSHCTEFAMGPLSALGIADYGDESDRRATHEDYTVAILLNSSLGELIDESFPFTARHVAALVSRDIELEDDFFVDGDVEVRTALSQIVSSELDVDRLDYLVRDSYFSGANYGHVDTNWILNNLACVANEGQLSLAIERRAIYAFDDFMIARYHMFSMVYFHHRSVICEEMLKRYFQSDGCSFSIPVSLSEYLHVDDVQLWTHLREADDPWCRALVEGREWKRALELHGEDVDTSWAVSLLDDNGIESITASSVGKLSRYDVYGKKRTSAPPIFVLADPLDPTQGISDLRDATSIFDRYRDERRISRVYVHPDERDRAAAILQTSPGRQLSLI